MYRGTAGTEVAYLLRQLLHLLGVNPGSPQVRFIATSASLGQPHVARGFLSDFFGVDPASFDIHEGQPRPLSVAAEADLDAHARTFEGFARTEGDLSVSEAPGIS